MEKEINQEDLSKIDVEVSFSPETNEKIDELDAISLDNIAPKETKPTTLENDLLEITSLQKEQQSQNAAILKTLDNLNNVITSDKETDVNVVEQDPVVAALEDLKLETKDNNQELIKEFQTLKSEPLTVSSENNSMLLGKFDDLNETVSNLNKATVSQSTTTENVLNQVIEGNNVLNQNLTKNDDQYTSLNQNITKNGDQYTDALNQITTNNKDQFTEVLNQIDLNNQSNLTEIQNLQKDNNTTLNQLNSENVSNQNIQSILEKIETVNNDNFDQNNKFLDTLNEIKTTNNEELSIINTENKELIDKQSTLNTVNVSPNAETISPQLVEKNTNLTIVKDVVEKNEKEIENNKTTAEKNSATLKEIENKVSNFTNNTNQITALQPKIVEDNGNSELIKMLNYSAQIQNGMLQLLQQLVDGQNMKRYTDSPIKN